MRTQVQKQTKRYPPKRKKFIRTRQSRQTNEVRKDCNSLHVHQRNPIEILIS